MNTETHITPNTLSPARPKNRFAPRPAFLDPSPLRAEFERMHTALREDDRTDANATLTLVEAGVRVIQFLSRVVAYNWAIKRKWDMLTNPKWRRRVLSALGGEPALQRWEARKARLLEPLREVADRSSPAAGRYSQNPRDRNRFKTDADGLFRLAPLTREREPGPSYRGLSGVSGCGPSDSSFYKPIPLTADELRGHCIDPYAPDDAMLDLALARLAILTEAESPADPQMKIAAADEPARALISVNTPGVQDDTQVKPPP